MLFVMINSLEYIKIHENGQKPFLDHFFAKNGTKSQILANFFSRILTK